MPDPIPYFDGHNDVLLRLALKSGGDPVADFLDGDGQGHLDLPRAREGNFVGGLFAMFSPSEARPNFGGSAPKGDLPPLLAPEMAWSSLRKQSAILMRIIERGGDRVALCRTVGDIRGAIASNRLAIVFHVEGADAIEADLDLLHALYGIGLRTLGPVWSRPTIFGHGVPFRFPHDPDIGDGLTGTGKDLVRECNRLRVMIDLSHMNAKGFRDVAALSDAPLVASHSNVHAICPSPRNLTDWQLDAIRDSDGFVGLNFGTYFVREDGKMNKATSLDMLARHLDALIEKLGEDRVGIGSDFDGAAIPDAIGSVAGSQNLFDHLRGHGYDDPLLRKIGAENWLAVLERTWGK